MKMKTMSMVKTVLYLSGILCAAALTPACNQPADPLTVFLPSGGGTNDPVITDVDNSEALTRYVATPVSGGYELKYSYSDGAYDYYYFYLGKVEDVPLWRGTIIRNDGNGDILLGHVETTSETTGYQEALAECITKTTTTSRTNEDSVTGEASVSYFGIGAKAGYSHKWSTTEGTSEAKAVTNTYTTIHQYLVGKTTEQRFTVKSTQPFGYYRPTVLTTCDVYAVAIKERSSGEIFYICEAFTRLTDNDVKLAIEYSKDGSFPERDALKVFTFDPAWVDSVPAGGIPGEWQVETPGNNKTIRVEAEQDVLFINGKETGAVSNMQIVVPLGRPSEKELNIIMWDLEFTGPEGKAAIDAGTFAGKITLEVVGTNSVSGGVQCGSLEIKSTRDTDTLTLTGFNGYATSFSGNSVYTTGGNGITASGGVIVDGAGISIYGGGGNNTFYVREFVPAPGGHGVYCANGGVVVRNASVIAGGRGGHGGSMAIPGKSGGDGGNGIHCANGGVVLEGNVSVTGGEGGEGGFAFTIPGITDPSVEALFKAEGRARGGDGGNGGWGVAAKSYTVHSNGVTVKGGAKGVPGKFQGLDGIKREWHVDSGKTAGGEFKQL
jgi:hypothetical protein